VAQIAAVLADVHRVDIVHRDIKPGNVMINDGGLVKVLDFGIAILRGAAALPRLTQVDRPVGTPGYMSPEQCLGQIVTAPPTSTRWGACSWSCSPATRRSSRQRIRRCARTT
jgi:serine/threonine protein kinase